METHLTTVFLFLQYVFLAMYNSSLCALVACGITLGVKTSADTTYLIIVVATNVAAVGNVCLILLPKMHNAREGIVSKTFFSNQSAKSSSTVVPGTALTAQNPEIKELQKQAAKDKLEISRLNALIEKQNQ